MSKLNPNIVINTNERGVSIFVNGKWIMDASCFKDDGIIRISKDRGMKGKFKFWWEGTKEYIWRLK